MGKWVDQFGNHQVHKQLASTQELLDSLEWPSDQLDIADAVQRLRLFVGHVLGVLQRVNPELVPTPTLNNLNDIISRTNAEITNFRNSKNVAHLNNANNQADTALVALSQIPFPRMRKEVESLADSVKNYRTMVDAIVKDLAEDVKLVEKEIQNASLHSADSDKRIGELNDMVSKQKERIDSIITDYQRQFSDSQDKRQTSFVNQLAKQAEENTKKLAELSEEIAKFLSQKEADAKAQIEYLEVKKKEASDLVQVIGNIGVTGNFNKIANEEKISADRYRRIALGLMLAIFCVITYVVYEKVDKNVDWKLALFRMSTALILAFPAWYAAHESARHRSNEARNRRIELELASIDPYMEKLPEETKRELKSRLTEKYFGMNEVDQKPDELPKNLVELLKVIVAKIPGGK